MRQQTALQRTLSQSACDPAVDSVRNPGNPAPLPGIEQTAETLRHWLTERAVKGAIVVVRHERRSLYEYHLDEIVRIDPHRQRVHLAQHGAFDFDGTGTSAPKGYLTLLEPTPPVLNAAAEGRTWQNGRPAFKRPLCMHEVSLARTALARDPVHTRPVDAKTVTESTLRSKPRRHRDRRP
jgi:hypothetical protein